MAPPQMGGRVSRGVAFLFGVDMILARPKHVTQRGDNENGNTCWKSSMESEVKGLKTCRSNIWVFPKIGVPKMDGENHGKPY